MRQRTGLQGYRRCILLPPQTCSRTNLVSAMLIEGTNGLKCKHFIVMQHRALARICKQALQVSGLVAEVIMRPSEDIHHSATDPEANTNGTPQVASLLASVDQNIGDLQVLIVQSCAAD